MNIQYALSFSFVLVSTKKSWRNYLDSLVAKYSTIAPFAPYFKMQRRWVDGIRMCDSHCEAWKKWCDGVGMLFKWHCWWSIQNSKHI